MNLPVTIKKLLEENKKVILPGFGTLEMKEGGSEVSSSGKMLTPPGVVVRFDSSFSKDDGRLSSFFSEETGIENEEASQQVLELIDEIKFSLDKGEEYNASGLGVFYRDEDQKTRFKMDRNWIIDPDQYGLDSVELFELDETVSADSGVNLEPDLSDEAGDMDGGEQEKSFEQAAKDEMVAPEQVSLSDESNHSRKLWRVIWIVAGSLIVVLVIVLLIPVNEGGEAGSHRGREGFLLNRKKSVEKRENVVEIPEEEVAIPSPQVDAEVIEEKLIEEEAPVIAHKYFIIAGSFKSLQNASDLQDNLRSQGYSSDIIITENRMYRVSLESYATKEEALNALENLKKDSRFENFWVLTN